MGEHGIFGRYAILGNTHCQAATALAFALGLNARIVQKSQGFTGRSFNTREFFHGRTPRLLAERRFFFAQANHPQNLYYQSIA